MSITLPAENASFVSGAPVPLQGFGWLSDPETRKPPKVEGVTYQIDNGSANRIDKLNLHVTVSGYATRVDYEAIIDSLADGVHVITVTVQYNIDVVEDSVTVVVGAPPTDLDFAAACTMKSALTFQTAEQVKLRVSGPEVTIVSFPAITSSTDFGSSDPKVKLTTETSMVSSGIGVFNAVDGMISIPDVVLSLKATITATKNFPVVGDLSFSVTEEATLAVTLTTDQTSSPEIPPVLTDNGERLHPDGKIALAGDGAYSSPIFGMTDGGIILAGFVSPNPFPHG